MDGWSHEGLAEPSSAVRPWPCVRLAAPPVNSLLSLLAIGVALALPAGGQMLLSPTRHLAGTTSAVRRRFRCSWPQRGSRDGGNDVELAPGASGQGSSRFSSFPAKKPWHA
jgi:hypothetical protein